MKTYHQAYVEAYEKCQKARDAGKRFIEIRPWRDSYRLYAHKEYRGFHTFGYTDSICAWATKIANGMANKGYCELPVKGD